LSWVVYSWHFEIATFLVRNGRRSRCNPASSSRQTLASF